METRSRSSFTVTSSSSRERGAWYRFYLANTAYINNWDLVDVSAYRIVGPSVAAAPLRPLLLLARSKSLWERRIAITATFCFIRAGRLDVSLRIAEKLLRDREDLIHKAVGWMLREVGKCDRRVLQGFLDEHAAVMPRTMLRYAIERLPARTRRAYLARPRRPSPGAAGGGLPRQIPPA